jgi:hydrogenase maturation protein HypF
MVKRSCSNTDVRLQIAIQGIVQGVGFRPFIYRLAQKYALNGNISHTDTGVRIDVQGSPDALNRFQNEMIEHKPDRAMIAEVDVESLPLSKYSGFTIEDTALTPLPDTAICDACLKELFDSKNRRYLYPFLHCVSCGPRFSVREHTFSMCPECKAEYANPEDRRFYSQTNCCPQCGPKLEPGIDVAVEALREGKIVALQNMLLAVATNEEEGGNKTLLCPNLAEVEKIAEVSAIEKAVLRSAAAPIVMLKKKNSNGRQSPYVGVMLPHTALQYLLLHYLKKPLVVSHGNNADLILMHNLKMSHQLCDSIVHVIGEQPILMRRGRGYVPNTIEMPSYQTLFAAGGQLQNSFAFLKEGKIYASQHIGDLDSEENRHVYAQEIQSWEKLLDIHYAEGVGDKHPDYYSTQYVLKKNISSTRIQHHQAHVWSGMIDNNLTPPFFSIVWDGTGWGDDGTIWGGEAFSVGENSMKRIASLYPFRLKGGEKAKDAKYAMISLLDRYQGNEFTEEELIRLQGSNAPLCSSMNKLFDGVSALLGCSLENAAYSGKGEISYEIPLIKEKNLYLLDWRPMIKQIVDDKARSVAEKALAFHDALAKAMVSLAKLGNSDAVLLTGSVMQNKLLVEKAIGYLKAAGFTPYTHRQIPPNDEGIAVGQLIGRLRRGSFHAL